MDSRFLVLLLLLAAAAVVWLQSQLAKTTRDKNSLISLMEFGQELGITLNDENLTALIFKMIKNMFNSSACALYVKEPAGAMKLKAAEGAGVWRGFHPEAARTVLSDVVLKKRPANFGDIHDVPEENEQVIPRSKHIHAVMAAPLVSEEEILGVLAAGSAYPKTYTKDSLKLFAALANQTAAALRNILLHEKTARLAVTDSVSGLYTHGHMQEILEKELANAKRENRPLSVVILDVDRFKVVNDDYGHPQGDSLLRQLASIIKSVVRVSDSVCRYGGDEIFVILTDTDTAAAAMVAEQIRQIVQDYDFVLGSRVTRVTVSGGVASYPAEAAAKKDLIERADAELYRAKKSGRNKICSSLRLFPRVRQTGF